MNALDRAEPEAVCGRIDGEGRLIEADPPLAALQQRAGGSEGGALAVPQIAGLARLAARLGIVVSRGVVAGDGDKDLDLWVRAMPEGDEVAVTITSWSERPARTPTGTADVIRRADFQRAAADWTWETDEALRFTHLSPAATGAIGRPAAELIGEQLTSLFHFREGEDGALPILAALAEQRRFDDQYAELRSGDGERYRLSGLPLIDGAGRFAGFRGAAASLPRWMAAPDDAHKQQAADPGAFGERLDQALRSPLDVIVANAESMATAADGPLSADYADYARDIATAGRHLLELVDDLIDLQAIERPGFAPALEEIDLADVARRAAGLLGVRASAQGVRIDRPADDEHVPARGDFRRALQILMNLLTNAIRYSPEGGQVWIRTEQEGDLACVIVADQGKGIAEEDQARIFDKFERIDTTEPGGTGLGLYIARRLARAMVGDIAVDSAPGQGARFTFTLPIG